MDRIFGIDLGTTNSVIAHTDPNGVTEVIAGRDGDRIVPSVVYFPPSGDPIVGTRARQYAITEPERVARLFKRGMGEKTFLPDGRDFVIDGRTWPPELLSSMVLRKLAQMAEEHYGEPARRAVITVPAYFGEPERAATKSAGELAGLEVLRIVNEPTAAALAHGLDHQKEAGRVLVFDLGGGTFDVTVMDVGSDGSLNVIATGGDRQLGGADFDELIVQRISRVAGESGLDILGEPWTRQDAYAKAEDIKKDLSTLDTATRPVTAGGRPLMFTLTRAGFEKLLSPHLERVGDITVHTLEEADIDPGSLTRVLMVGGSSRIPAFQGQLQRLTGKEPTFSRNLDEDVARGAAILGAKLGGELNPRSELAAMPMPVDAASKGLGVTVLDTGTQRLMNSVIIPAGTAIPVTREETFYTAQNNQTGINVRLNEGDDDELEFVRQLGENPGTFRRPVPVDHPVLIKISYTADQLIRLEAHDGQDGSYLCEIEVRREGIMSDAEKAVARKVLDAMKVQ